MPARGYDRRVFVVKNNRDRLDKRIRRLERANTPTAVEEPATPPSDGFLTGFPFALDQFAAGQATLPSNPPIAHFTTNLTNIGLYASTLVVVWDYRGSFKVRAYDLASTGTYTDVLTPATGQPGPGLHWTGNVVPAASGALSLPAPLRSVGSAVLFWDAGSWSQVSEAPANAGFQVGGGFLWSLEPHPSVSNLVNVVRINQTTGLVDRPGSFYSRFGWVLGFCISGSQMWVLRALPGDIAQLSVASTAAPSVWTDVDQFPWLTRLASAGNGSALILEPTSTLGEFVSSTVAPDGSAGTPLQVTLRTNAAPNALIVVPGANGTNFLYYDGASGAYIDKLTSTGTTPVDSAPSGTWLTPPAWNSVTDQAAIRYVKAYNLVARTV
jgi:hypothetical protein